VKEERGERRVERGKRKEERGKRIEDRGEFNFLQSNKLFFEIKNQRLNFAVGLFTFY